MKKKLIAIMVLTAGSLLAADLSIGIRIGAPPPPRVVRVRPVAPGPGFAWVDGYWYPEGKHYKWHEGYWTRAPYEGRFGLDRVTRVDSSTAAIGKGRAAG